LTGSEGTVWTIGKMCKRHKLSEAAPSYIETYLFPQNDGCFPTMQAYRQIGECDVAIQVRAL
jgi:hypothetical protein